MMSPFKRSALFLSLIAFQGSWSAELIAQNSRSAWQVESQTKSEARIQDEDRELDRTRVLIRRNIQKGEPSIRRESIAFEDALRYKRLEKTQELIGQLEDLSKRSGQSARRGELQMRLAELYFERARDVASQESEAWRKAVEKWEALDPSDRAKSPRPVLRTPRADTHRRESLKLYSSLESRSRGADRGRSQLIQRDEVLFYLGMTYVDLGQGRQAEVSLFELVSKYPSSPRVFGARLQLADLYFDRGAFKQALPLYLALASGRSDPELSKQVRPYVFYKLAWSYFNTGAYDKAVLAYKRTAELAEEGDALSFKTEAQRDLARTFALAGQYDEGFRYFQGNKELTMEHLRNSADLASSRGQTNLALGFYARLINEDPDAPESKDYAMARLDIVRRSANSAQVAAQINDILKNYAADSSWLGARPSGERGGYVEELVGLIRRETKAMHAAAQKSRRDQDFAAAEPYYRVYFQNIPDPNQDKPENVHEMRFFYGELLYRLKRYGPAEKMYAEVGPGKFASNAAYARILALREDKGRAKDLLDATEDFIKKHPNDNRGSDLLYSSAFEAYTTGNKDSSKETLLTVMQRYPKTDVGLKSAERYLFLLEEQNDLEEALKGSELVSKNSELMGAHSKTLAPKLRDFQEKLYFKRAEQMSDSSSGDAAKKSEAFLALVPSVSGSLQEKALNNAVVFAQKAKDEELTKRAGQELLRRFPKSSYSRSLYVQQGEELARLGDWSKAIATYDSYLNLSRADKSAKKEDIEVALWNKIFIESHLQDQVGLSVSRPRAASKQLSSLYTDFLKDYPRSRFRPEVLEFAASDIGATEASLNAWARLPSLSSQERSMLEQARLARTLRTTPVKGRAALLKTWPSNKAKDLPWELRRVLASWAFDALESDFAAYQRQRLNFKGAAFATTLNSKKKSLESLEAKYINAVAYGDGDVALKSLVRIANANRDFAAELSKAPVPQADLAAFLAPFTDKHRSLLEQCLTRAVDLKIAGAGLSECRDQLRSIDASRVPLQFETVLSPGFIQAPSDATRSPLWNITERAFREGRDGEFLLGLKVIRSEMEAGRIEKSWEEYLKNLQGLQFWRQGAAEGAVKNFRETLDTSGSDHRDLRRVGAMNLAAIYTQLGDYREAASLMEGLAKSGPEAALIAGVAQIGNRDPKEAAKILDDASSSFKQRRELLFNAALAWKAAGDNEKAVDRIRKYIELEAPPTQHASRQLLRSWRGN